MKKLKKNFRKIPFDILNKTEHLGPNGIIVSCVKQIPYIDIQNELYKHLGIIAGENTAHFENTVLPQETSGRYSKYNINGRTIILKHLPKVIASYSFETPNFGDWSKGSHIVTQNRKIYQREFRLPKLLHINIELLEQNEDAYVFKFSLDTILAKTDSTFMNDLLFHCNLLQENIGSCDVFDSNSSDSEYIRTLYVSWELLPPGNRIVTAVTNTLRNPSPQVIQLINERIEFFNTLSLQHYIRGKNTFSQYFGAALKNSFVILENIRYGNAIYIFKKDWETFSKLSRTELLNIPSEDFVRIVHSSNWKNNVLRVVSETPKEISN